MIVITNSHNQVDSAGRLGIDIDNDTVFYVVVWYDYFLIVRSHFFFFFKQNTAYEISECDWSSDVCSSDLTPVTRRRRHTRFLNVTGVRSEEHTSELKSHSEISYAVFCLKKKTKTLPKVMPAFVTLATEITSSTPMRSGFSSFKITIRFEIFFLMILRPPRSTPYPTLFPYTTLFLSYRKSTRLNPYHLHYSRMPPSACDF